MLKSIICWCDFPKFHFRDSRPTKRVPKIKRRACESIENTRGGEGGGGDGGGSRNERLKLAGNLTGNLVGVRLWWVPFANRSPARARLSPPRFMMAVAPGCLLLLLLLHHCHLRDSSQRMRQFLCWGSHGPWSNWVKSVSNSKPNSVDIKFSIFYTFAC